MVETSWYYRVPEGIVDILIEQIAYRRFEKERKMRRGRATISKRTRSFDTDVRHRTDFQRQNPLSRQKLLM